MKLFTQFFLGSALLLPTLSACAQTPAESAQPQIAAQQAATAPNPLLNKAEFGVNLEGLADWSRALMFADAMKTSRAWGRLDKPWENENTVKTDAQGWPLEDAGIVVIADVPDIGGTYRLSFKGKAEVSSAVWKADIANLKYAPAKGITTADVIVPDGKPGEPASVMLVFKNTNGGVKNVKLMRPGTTDKDVFTPAFLDKLKPFQTLRLMDYLSTNNNPLKTWAERTTPDSATQARAQGGALEYAIQLSNLTGKDLWVNVPDQLDEAGVRAMAQMLKDGLTKNQKVYVEWSNEVWNWQFGQATRNLADAKAEVAAGDSPLDFANEKNDGYSAMRRIAKRGAETGQIFREVFGDQNMNRVRPVYATQVGYEEVYKQGLYFMEHQYKQPSSMFYGMAGAPYFQISDELNKKANLTEDEIFAAMPADMKKNLDGAALLGSYARFYNLHHLAYEGGQHLHDPNNVGNANVKIEANRDPRMGQLMQTYLKGWESIGGENFMYFALSSGYSKWGSWGLVEDIRAQTSPKYEAIVKVIDGPAVPLEIGTKLPGTVAAGDFSAMNRWDKKGAPTVRVEPDKWIQYEVVAPKTGTYQLTAQLSSGENASAKVMVNAKDAAQLQVAAGDQTATAMVPLEGGLNVIRVMGDQGRFDLKSFDIAP